MPARVDGLVLDGGGDVPEEQSGLDRAQRDVGALAVRMRGGGLAVETEETALGSLIRGPALEEREEVATAVLGGDHRLARFGDLAVGALARQPHVGDQLAVVGHPDRRPEGPPAEALGHLVGVVDPGRRRRNRRSSAAPGG